MFGRKPKRHEPGRPLSAAKINQLADNAEWISKLSVAPPLAMQYNPTGTHIYLQRPEPVLARLSGSTSPYSWVEVYSSAPGTLSTLPGGRSGTANAYELNNRAGCTAVVELTAMGGWYAFQWIGDGPPCGWRFVTTGCIGDPLVGCLVEIRQSGTLIDSCTTAEDGTVAKIKLVTGGTGYTNGSYTNGTFSGVGGSGGTFSYSVSGGVIQPTITITNAGTGYTSTPTPVFNAGPGSGVLATAFLRASCRLTPPAGTYDVTVSGPSSRFAANTAIRSFACPSSADVKVDIALGSASTHVCAPVCNFPVAKTLYTTDGLGTHTLTWNGTAWAGTGTTSTGTIIFGTIPAACNVGGAMTVFYTLSTSFGLSISWPVAPCKTGSGVDVVLHYSWVSQPGSVSGPCWQYIFAGGSAIIDSCSPLSVTVDVTMTGTPSGGVDYCGTGPGGTTYDGYNTPGGGGLIGVTE